MSSVNNILPALSIKLLSLFGKIPTKGSEHAAGYDLYSASTGEVPPRGRICINTDIAVKVPYGTYGRVAPRSGLTLKNGIDVGAGVIDADFGGNIGVILFNHTDTPFKFATGDRIAQFILECIVPDAVIDVVDTLPETVRGDSGFGSTGNN